MKEAGIHIELLVLIVRLRELPRLQEAVTVRRLVRLRAEAEAAEEAVQAALEAAVVGAVIPEEGNKR